MAKDGTLRGGRRIKAGTKPDALVDKVAKGNAAEVMRPPMTELEGTELSGSSPEGSDMPKPDTYLSELQRDGKPLGADIIYEETWKWLKKRGCEKLISKRALEAYSQAFARYIQCEQAISHYGLLGKHPTTGAAIASPFVSIGQSYQRQADLIWAEIFQVVKENSLTPYEGDPQGDSMEALLNMRV